LHTIEQRQVSLDKHSIGSQDLTDLKLKILSQSKTLNDSKKLNLSRKIISIPWLQNNNIEAFYELVYK
jgi:hypothetical protein